MKEAKRRRERVFAVEELLTTERTYVGHMQALVKCFVEPLYQWCEEGGCDWGCDEDDEDSGSDYSSEQHGDYCYFCTDISVNCEEYCYEMEECPDQWCEEGGCDWAECGGHM